MTDFKAAVGKRNSQDDQDNLDSAHDALVSAGAQCGDNTTAQTKGAHPAHQKLLDVAHDSLVAAGANCDNAPDDADASDGSSRAAQAGRDDAPPDPYAPATIRAAQIRKVLHPTTDDGYEPKGTPPDPYRMALAMRTALASDDLTIPKPMLRDDHGTPDGYATALAKRR